MSMVGVPVYFWHDTWSSSDLDKNWYRVRYDANEEHKKNLSEGSASFSRKSMFWIAFVGNVGNPETIPYTNENIMFRRDFGPNSPSSACDLTLDDAGHTWSGLEAIPTVCDPPHTHILGIWTNSV